MNWEAIGAIGEILSAVAVLFTLIYLAFQVREAKTSTELLAKNLEVSVSESVAKGLNELNVAIGGSQDNARIMWAMLNEPELLADSPVDMLRADRLWRSYNTQFAAVYRLGLAGLIPKEQAATYVEDLAELHATPGGRLFLERNVEGFRDYPEFIEAIRPKLDEALFTQLFGETGSK